MSANDSRKISDAQTIGAGNSVSGPAAARAPVNSASILQSGQLIAGRFEIREMLGEGGMGAVYKAYDRDIDRMIALKCIRPELSRNPEAVQRFTQELLLARQITHRNVIRIYDVRDSGGLKFITMEYIEGRDLGSLMNERGKLPPAEAISLIRQACAGLAAAHAEGVVHRDLKPNNIMLEANGRVVVMDFGLARSQSQTLMTQTGAVMGTLLYMSPEQAKGEKADGRSDIFTMGIILYELLTGGNPYASDNAITSLLKRTQEAATPVSSIETSVSPTLNRIVCKCLERDVTKRYQSMDDLIADLDGAQQGKSPSRLPSSLSNGRVGKLYWLLGAFLLVSLLVTGAIIRWSLQRPTSNSAAHATVKILLADFQNQTSDSVFDGTLGSSFGLAMEGAPFISAYNRAQAHKIMKQINPQATQLDDTNASLVAVREGVNVVIGGVVTRQGDLYTIECAAIDPVASKTLHTETKAGVSKSGVLQAVADLAGKMRQFLGDTTPASVKRQQQETVTSSSIEAVHEYAVAQEFQLSGKWDEAKAHYSRAIELDPNMGRAYAGIAAVSANLGRKPDAEKYYQAAMAHIDRMTDREKYRTRGGYYLMTRQPEKAIAEYEALVKEYPADDVGASNLALASFYTRDMAKAMRAGKDAADLSPKALAQRNNYALYAIYAGDYAAGAQAAGEVLQQDPTYPDALGALAMAQAGQGDFSRAASTYGILQALGVRGASMAAIGLADLAFYQGHQNEGIELLEKSIPADIAAKDQSSAATKSIALGQAHLAKGEKAQALAAADQAVKLSPDPSTAMAAGDLYIEAGETAKAARLASQLSSRIEPEPQMYGALLDGALALKKNQIKDAIDAFQKAQKISNTWLGHFYLGKAYLQNGSFTEADSEFEACLKRRGEASAVFLDDVPTFRLMPPVYYYLGRAQEGLKSPAAAESYRTFLKSQPEGTSDLVADARRRLQTN